MRIYPLIVGLFFSHGCGDSSDSGRSPDSNGPAPIFSLTVADTSKLPVCSPANQSQLVYLIEAKQFLHCDSGSWTPIDMSQLKGDPGPRGEPGPQGVSAEAALGKLNIGFGLFDAKGQLIGYPDSPTIAPDSDRYIMFIDGYIGQIRANYAQILLGDSSCYYSASQCTGPCLSLHGPRDPLGNHLLEDVSSKRLRAVPASAQDLGQLLYRSRWSGGQCEEFVGSNPKHFQTQDWNPAGIELPLAPPLRVMLIGRGTD